VRVPKSLSLTYHILEFYLPPSLSLLFHRALVLCTLLCRDGRNGRGRGRERIKRALAHTHTGEAAGTSRTSEQWFVAAYTHTLQTHTSRGRTKKRENTTSSFLLSFLYLSSLLSLPNLKKNTSVLLSLSLIIRLPSEQPLFHFFGGEEGAGGKHICTFLSFFFWVLILKE